MTTTKPPVLTDDDEEFNNWHVSYANRAPYLNAPEGMWVDDKKAYAAWKYAKEQAVLERAGADAVQIPEGYALVPIKPTKEMLAAGRKGVSYTQAPWLAERYVAMLEAAPAIRALKGTPAAAVADDEDIIADIIANHAFHDSEHGKAAMDKWQMRDAAKDILAHFAPQAGKLSGNAGEVDVSALLALLEEIANANSAQVAPVYANLARAAIAASKGAEP